MDHPLNELYDNVDDDSPVLPPIVPDDDRDDEDDVKDKDLFTLIGGENE